MKQIEDFNSLLDLKNFVRERNLEIVDIFKCSGRFYLVYIRPQD